MNTAVLIIGIIGIASVVAILLNMLIVSQRRASTQIMRARDFPQYGLRDNRTGEVEIKYTQAAAGNDPKWMYGPYSTVMRMVDRNGEPVPGEKGTWRFDFFPDP